jgi:hypothetical protein
MRSGYHDAFTDRMAKKWRAFAAAPALDPDRPTIAALWKCYVEGSPGSGAAGDIAPWHVFLEALAEHGHAVERPDLTAPDRHPS